MRVVEDVVGRSHVDRALSGFSVGFLAVVVGFRFTVIIAFGLGFVARRMGCTDEGEGRMVFGLCLGGIGHAEPLVDLRLIAEEGLVPDHTREDRPDSQHAKRRKHGIWAFVGVFVGVLVAARFAVEGQEHQAPAVEAGEEGEHGRARAACEGRLDDRVFRHETREADREADVEQRDTDAGDGQRADHHGPEGFWQLVFQAAVVPHVLLMVHGGDDRPRAKEQHCLEERVREQVEHGDRIGSYTGGNEHIPQLRHGRIGKDLLDIALIDGNHGSQQG